MCLQLLTTGLECLGQQFSPVDILYLQIFILLKASNVYTLPKHNINEE